MSVATESIPDELRQLDQCVCWKSVMKPGAKKPTKMPFQPDGKPAEANNPATWHTYADCVAACERNKTFAGIGIELGARDDDATLMLAGVDLDNCIDPHTGEFHDDANQIIERLDTYAEISPSNCGVKLLAFVQRGFAEGRKFPAPWGGTDGRIELYSSGRFFTLTGKHLSGTPGVIEDRTEQMHELYDRLQSERRAEQARKAAPSKPVARRDADDVPMDRREERCWKYVEKLPDAISGQGGHDRTLNAACECLRFGLDDSAAWRILNRFNDLKTGGEKWNDTELRHKLDSARSKVNGDFGCRLREDRPGQKPNRSRSVAFGSKQDDPADAGQPIQPAADYVLVPGKHSTQYNGEVERGNDVFADEAIGRLPDGSLYRRDVVPGQLNGEAGAMHFRQVGCDDLRIIIDRQMKLGQWRRRGSGESERYEIQYLPCNRDHSNIILSQASTDRRIPELKLIASYPTFVDGFKLAVPGFYDGVFYDEPDTLKDLNPERDAEVIRQTFDDLLIDFPFKSLADVENYVGLLVTVAVRNVINGNMPGHMIHATLERTGKSKLAEMVGMVYLGRRTPATQMADNDSEMQKRLTAMLIAGETLLHFDNIAELIDLPSFASLMTCQTFSGRLLGSSTMLNLANTLIPICTANNPKMTGEIAKRMVPILLEAKTDAPELRTDFKHPDLWKYVTDNRRLILSCVIGMVLNWRDAGKPRGTQPMGGFDEWASAVGGIMQHAGYHKWMTNAKAWRGEADPFRSDLKAMVGEWVHLHNDNPQPMKVGELLAIAQSKELFPAILGTKEGKALETSFGMRVLARHVGTPVGKWKLIKNSISRPAVYALHRLEVTE